MRYSFDELAEFCTALFRAAGVVTGQAEVTARRLVEADFRGRTGHGLIRVVPYLERIRAGGINTAPNLRVLNDTAVSAQIDADNALGQVAMTMATQLAMAKAAEAGVGVVGTVRSNHAGAAGLYPAMLAENNLVGMYFAVANANGMPPWGGNTPLLGTNPIAIGIPCAQGHPFLLDIATTTASHGTIKVAQRSGEQMPIGWIVDPDGAPITDPTRAGEGFLVPIGGYKGSGLNIAIGLLAGILNGAAFGRSVVDHRADHVTPTNTGQLVIAFRADLFRPLETVLAEIAEQLSELRNSGSMDGRPLRLPGDRAAEVLQQNQSLGLALPEPLLRELNAAGVILGVASELRGRH